VRAEPTRPTAPSTSSPQRHRPNVGHPDVEHSDVDAQDARYAWRVLSVTGIGMLVTFFNASMLPVALPDMSADLSAGTTQANWFMLAYLLVNSVLILVLGRVSDLIGRRPVYLAGLAVLTLTGLGIGLARDPTLVIVLRAVQGAGAAAVITNTTALLADAFPARLLAMGIGLNITVMSAGLALGPLAGGLLTETTGWRGVFLVNLPLGAVGLLWAARVLRRPAPRRPVQGRPGRDRPGFDLAGAVVSAAGLGALVYALNSAGDGGWQSPRVWGFAAAGLVLLAVLVRIEIRAQDPVVDLRLIAQRFRGLAYAATFTVTTAEGAVAVLLSLYLQSARGIDPVRAGLMITPLAVGTTLASPVAGRLAARFPARGLASAGIGVSAVAMATVTAITAEVTSFPLPVALLVLGLGGGVFKTVNAAAINVGVLPAQRGMANGLRVMLDNTAVVLATAVMLVLATVFLPAADRLHAYRGELAALGATGHDLLTAGFGLAFAVMTGLELLALGWSLLRGPTPSETVRPRGPAAPPSNP